MKEAIKKSIDEGVEPEYITQRGKFLWVDNEHNK